MVLGEGDPGYHRVLSSLQAGHPGQVAVQIGQDEKLAHQIEAGADIFLMPSQYEPCGLNQLYSLKYGTVPVVRATGGLANTVVDATDRNLAEGTATGFVFVPPAVAGVSRGRPSCPDHVPRTAPNLARPAADRHASGLVLAPQRRGLRKALPPFERVSPKRKPSEGPASLGFRKFARLCRGPVFRTVPNRNFQMAQLRSVRNTHVANGLRRNVRQLRHRRHLAQLGPQCYPLGDPR